MKLVPADNPHSGTDYWAYMLRLWREDASLPWRASLQDPHTGEQYHFATLAQLFAYLEQKTTVSKKNK